MHSLDRLKLDLKVRATLCQDIHWRRAERSQSKAGKRRADLVSSMDSLSTQLPSTFQALSYSLASSTISISATTAAYLAIITGPTPTTSKARFFVRIQGLRLIQDPSHTGEHQADLDTQQSNEVEDPDISFQSFTSGMFSALSSIDDDPISQPPSPSTSCPLVFEEEEDIPHHLRLLNLTLSTGISFNRPSLPLTNTHILLLAPRCFRHPSWLPKQNLNEKKIPVRTFFNDGVVGKNDEGVTVDAGLREVPDAQETAGNGDDMIWWIWSGSGPLKGFDVL